MAGPLSTVKPTEHNDGDPGIATTVNFPATRVEDNETAEADDLILSGSVRIDTLAMGGANRHLKVAGGIPPAGDDPMEADMVVHRGSPATTIIGEDGESTRVAHPMAGDTTHPQVDEPADSMAGGTGRAMPDGEHSYWDARVGILFFVCSYISLGGGTS
jgi:hypothetical protein